MKVDRRWNARPNLPAPLSRARVLAVLAGLLMLAGAILFRLGDIQLVHHSYYAERAERQYRNRRPIEPLRGRILDRCGNELVANLPNYYSVGVRPGDTRDKIGLSRKLATILEEPVSVVQAHLESERNFVWIERKVHPHLAQQIAALSDSAVVIQRETKRQYIYGPVGGQILGFVDIDNKGRSGIENQFETVLAGEPGWEVLQKYGSYRQLINPDYPRQEATDGGTVVLSLDVNAQAIAEEELEAAVERYHGASGMIIVTRPATGEILAMASMPRYDPNEPGDFNAMARKNRAVTDGYEPGSTFKIVPFAALIDQDRVKIDEWIDCENGRFRVADRIIRDSHPYEKLTAKGVLAKSSNIGTVKLADRLTPKEFYTVIRDFGFGQESGIELTGETKGILLPPDRWSGVTQANMSIGQGITVTALQLAMAYGAIANNGMLMKPLLVLSVTHPDGRTELREPRPVRRVIRPSTARMVRLILEEAVLDGTGGNAKIEGVRVAGKTGTAQKVDSANRTYFQDRYVSSFIGMLPTEHPEYLCLVVIDDPRGDIYYGGSVAAPVFRNVMERLLVILPRQDALFADQPPDKEPIRNMDALEVPHLVTLTRNEAQGALSGMGLVSEWVGEGDVVIGQGTPPGTAVLEGAKVQVVLGPSAIKEGRVMTPDLTGLDLREAVATLSRMGLRSVVEGSGQVLWQEPAKGEFLSVGADCRLYAGEAGQQKRRAIALAAERRAQQLAAAQATPTTPDNPGGGAQ